MFSGRLNDALDVRNVRRNIVSPRGHVADDRQHSVVGSFYDHSLGEENTDPVARVQLVQFFMGGVDQDAANGVRFRPENICVWVKSNVVTAQFRDFDSFGMKAT